MMSFQDRLLVELKAEMSRRADHAPTRQLPATRRRLLVGAAVVAAATAAAVALPIVTGTHAAAYAVTKNADGSISVRINQLRDPDRLEHDLANLGVHVDVSYHRSVLTCPGGRYATSDPTTPGQPMPLGGGWLVSDGKNGFKVYPDRMRPGETATLRVDVDTTNPDMMWVGSGPPPPCPGR
jgi:hypothetical protein